MPDCSIEVAVLTAAGAVDTTVEAPRTIIHLAPVA